MSSSQRAQQTSVSPFAEFLLRLCILLSLCVAYEIAVKGCDIHQAAGPGCKSAGKGSEAEFLKNTHCNLICNTLWYLRAEQELDNQFQSMFKERDRAQNQDGNNEISQAAARDAENDKKVREVEASNGKLRQVSTRKIVVRCATPGSWKGEEGSVLACQGEVQKVEGDKKAQEVEVGIKRLQWIVAAAPVGASMRKVLVRFVGQWRATAG
ncbi:hypothetical protein F4604DRAFT_1912268 [Suillus subluteus]|nr:hypothetical protein F4604DRAFT_1912268 [Suillus subluteus]